MMSSATNDGIALYVHSGKDSDVHGKLARRFGSHMWNAPDRIAAAAKAIDKEAVSLQLNSKIYFPTLDGSSYERLKHVDNYRHHPKSSQEIRWPAALQAGWSALRIKKTRGGPLETRPILITAAQPRR
jgi:hypothetical protein